MTYKKPQNIIQKIWDLHVIKHLPGHPAILAIDLQLIHEVTSPQAFAKLDEKGLSVRFPQKMLATLDHSVPTRPNRQEIYDEVAKKQVQTLRENTAKYGLTIYDFDSGKQGIVHVIGPELGLTQPGMTIVCGDSHTSTHGAFGALAFGIGTTEVPLVLATGCILQSPLKTMKIEFQGKLPKGVYSKDMILALIRKIGIGGGNGFVFEYTGQAIRDLSMEARMSLCNMSIEAGARAGLISPDKTTFEYILGEKVYLAAKKVMDIHKQNPERKIAEKELASIYNHTHSKPYSPKLKDILPKLQTWQKIASDDEAEYDQKISLDISNLKPMITWGINPAQAIEIGEKIPKISDFPKSERPSIKKALDYVKLEEGQSLEGLKFDWAFLGSCTNSRIEDLRIAAQILKNKKIAPGITLYVVPGSEQVKKQAESEGLDKIFKDAGGGWRNPGCSMCLGMNDDKVPSGSRCLSTSNRNFMHRQGPGAITHLVSPATLAKSCLNGKIVKPPQQE